MNVTWLIRAAKLTKGFAVRYAPEILAGLGCGGVALTALSVVRDTIKHAERELERPDNRRKAELVLDTMHDYAPSIAAAAVTMATIIVSNRISARRIAGLAATLAASQKQLAEFKAAAKEVVGPESADKIDEYAKRKAQFMSDGPIIRWKEDISGDEFFLPKADVLWAEMEINRRFHMCHGSSVNEFRHEVNLGPLDHGVDYVWDKDEMPDEEWIQFIHSHEIDPKGEYIRISYFTKPCESIS